MYKTKVILLTGRAQSGKDTAGFFLRNKLEEEVANQEENRVKMYSFATALKDIAIEIFNIERHKVYGIDVEKNELTHIKWDDLPLSNNERDQLAVKGKDTTYLTGREFLQVFGTNICRRLYGDCWAYRTLVEITKNHPRYAILTDVRFPNELDIFDLKNNPRSNISNIENEPIVIRLLRNPLNMQHDSEIALNSYNFEKFSNFIAIDNRKMDLGDKNQLIYQRVKELL